MSDPSFLTSIPCGDDPANRTALSIIQPHVDAILAAQGCLSDFSDGEHARRILSDLLGTGWTPPGGAS